ncbi:MAG: hypothetical protein ABW032_06580 [Burkholderiaceae bacterium]
MVTTANHVGLWDLVKSLEDNEPLTKHFVEQALQTKLEAHADSSNSVVEFFKCGPVKLQSGILTKIDFRFTKERPESNFLILSITGPCVSFAQVRQRYGNLKITNIPRGRSLEEMTSHSVDLEWGRLSFGFRARNPNCLAAISFDTH